jgi:hypothetical protein
VPIPPIIKVAIDTWVAAAGLSEGPLFPPIIEEAGCLFHKLTID